MCEETSFMSSKLVFVFFCQSVHTFILYVLHHVRAFIKILRKGKFLSKIPNVSSFFLVPEIV